MANLIHEVDAARRRHRIVLRGKLNANIIETGEWVEWFAIAKLQLPFDGSTVIVITEQHDDVGLDMEPGTFYTLERCQAWVDSYKENEDDSI